MSVIVENAIDLALEREVPDILCSTLTDDCIGRGKHLKEGGAVLRLYFWFTSGYCKLIRFACSDQETGI